MFKNIVIVDPNEDDILEHSLYINGYKNFCKKNKIELNDFFILTENHGTTFELARLINSSNYRGHRRRARAGYYDLEHLLQFFMMENESTLVIINKKKINYINEVPQVRSIIQLLESDINYGKGFENIKCVEKITPITFVVIENIFSVPGPTYNKEFIKLYKMICNCLHVRKDNQNEV